MTSMCLQKIQDQGVEGFNKLKTQLSMNINSHKYHAMYFFTSDRRWLTKPNIGLDVSYIVEKKRSSGVDLRS